MLKVRFLFFQWSVNISNQSSFAEPSSNLQQMIIKIHLLVYLEYNCIFGFKATRGILSIAILSEGKMSSHLEFWKKFKYADCKSCMAIKSIRTKTFG